MAERPEDLNLPIAVVQRIIKESIPDGVIISKEARQTISRSSSVFVLYLTACAVTHANKAKRKTLAVNDIIKALGDMEFDSFVGPLNEALKLRKDLMEQKDKTSTNGTKKSSEKKQDADDEEADEVDEEEGDVDDDATAGGGDDDEAEMSLNVSNGDTEQSSKKRKLAKNNNRKAEDADDDDHANNNKESQ